MLWLCMHQSAGVCKFSSPAFAAVDIMPWHSFWPQHTCHRAASRCSSLPSALLPAPQFTTLFVRAIRVRRFETLSQQDLAQFLCVAAVCGMIWWQVGQTNTVYGAQNTTGLLFFEGE